MGFAKIYDSILRSSIWLESPGTKLVWITMLVLADKDGFVRASVGGLAHQAGVPREECVEALRVLSSPDLDSQTQEEEGRRIVDADGGGWFIVNHSKYREFRTEKQIRDAERARRYREKQRNSNDGGDGPVAGDASQQSRGVTGNHAASASASASDLNKEEVGGADPDSLPVLCPGNPLPDMVVAELAGAYSVSEAAIRSGIKEAVTYWTHGRGAGTRRTRVSWMRTFRDDIKRKDERGKLTEPDRPDPKAAAAIVAAREAETAREDEDHRRKLRESAQRQGSAKTTKTKLLKGIG